LQSNSKGSIFGKIKNVQDQNLNDESISSDIDIETESLDEGRL
jgi:hypothetical protein